MEAMDLKVRIAVERYIVDLTVDTLLKAGYLLAVDNGGDQLEVSPTHDAAKLKAGLMLADEETLLVRVKQPGTGVRSFVRFIYGNDGWDVINDYGVSLEAMLKPVNDVCDRIGDGDLGAIAEALGKVTTGTTPEVKRS
jgi:hypothetical protein